MSRGGWNKGIPWSEEMKKRFSIIKKLDLKQVEHMRKIGKGHTSGEFKKGHINWNTGMKWSGMSGKKQSESAKRLISLNHARHNLGKKHSPETIEKLKKAYKNGKRIKIGWGPYHKAHTFITKQLGKPMICSHCKTLDAKRYDWANVSGEYKHEVSDWLRLCVRCHINFDRHGELPCLISMKTE